MTRRKRIEETPQMMRRGLGVSRRRRGGGVIPKTGRNEGKKKEEMEEMGNLDEEKFCPR